MFPQAKDNAQLKPSLRLVNFNTFFMNIEYSCLMPTVYFYCTDVLHTSDAFYGLVLSVFSLTRMLVFIPVGIWVDKRNFREVFVITTFVSFCGCFMYGIAGYMENKWFLIVGRILSGLGASNTTLSRTYISKCVPAEEFTRRIGIQMALDLFGVMVGPVLISAFLTVDVTFFGWLHLDSNTAPGYLMACINLVMLCLYLFTFNEPPQQKQRKSIRRESLLLGCTAAEIAKNTSNFKAFQRVFFDGGGAFFVFTCFTVNFNLCALETIASPVTKDEFKWGKLELSVFFASCAMVGCVGMISGIKLNKKCAGYKVMFAGQACMISSFVVWLFFDSGEKMPLAPFLVGAGMCIFGLCLVTPANSGYYTKVVENQGGAQGLFGGVWSVFMSFGKSLGPLVAGQSLEYIEVCKCHWVVFAFCGPVVLLNFLLFPPMRLKAKIIDEIVRNKVELEKEKDLEANPSGEGLNESLLVDVVK